MRVSRRAANLSGYKTEKVLDIVGHFSVFFLCNFGSERVDAIIKVMIVTNNPRLAAHPDAEFHEASLLEILQRVRDLVHQNYRLLTHPLAGSVKPNETPYKSVALFAKPEAQLDMQSLQLIEGALHVAAKLLKDRPLPQWSEKVRDDFSLIDASLLESGLEGLKHF